VGGLLLEEYVHASFVGGYDVGSAVVVDVLYDELCAYA
jgi:hypothetical protein